jgi:hypothetical protein
MPRRMSVWPVAIQTLTPLEGSLPPQKLKHSLRCPGVIIPVNVNATAAAKLDLDYSDSLALHRRRRQRLRCACRAQILRNGDLGTSAGG